MACDRVDCHDAAIWDAIGLAVCSYLVINFGMRLKNVAVKIGMGCSLLFMHPQITEAELACLFWRSWNALREPMPGKWCSKSSATWRF